MELNIQQQLMRTANRDPYRLDAEEINELFQFIDSLSDEAFNYLARLDAPQPGVYIEYWKDNRREEQNNGAGSNAD